METRNKAEFTNKHGDSVSVVWMSDSFGGHHIITKVKRLRRDKEERVIRGKLAPIAVTTFTSEDSITYTEIELQAHIEFNMSRVMHGEPEYTNELFQLWLKSVTAEKEAN